MRRREGSSPARAGPTTVPSSWVTRPDGASQPQPLTPSGIPQLPWSFTPDGKQLAYFDRQIWTVALDDQGGRLRAGTPEPFLKSTFNDQAPSISPDGRALASGCWLPALGRRRQRRVT